MIDPVKRTLNFVLVTVSLGWALVLFSQGPLFAATYTIKVVGLKEVLTMALDYSPRLRSILMTTLSMIFGMMPIAPAQGAGSEWKNGMAIALIGDLPARCF